MEETIYEFHSYNTSRNTNFEALFRRISFAHIYRELNEEADTLSKQALAHEQGMLEIEEIVDGLSTPHYETI